MYLPIQHKMHLFPLRKTYVGRSGPLAVLAAGSVIGVCINHGGLLLIDPPCVCCQPQPPDVCLWSF